MDSRDRRGLLPQLALFPVGRHPLRQGENDRHRNPVRETNQQLGKFVHARPGAGAMRMGKEDQRRHVRCQGQAWSVAETPDGRRQSATGVHSSSRQDRRSRLARTAIQAMPGEQHEPSGRADLGGFADAKTLTTRWKVTRGVYVQQAVKDTSSAGISDACPKRARANESFLARGCGGKMQSGAVRQGDKMSRLVQVARCVHIECSKGKQSDH